MTRLSWGTLGERFYEAGVDRGVLYHDGLNGVAWNGLTSVRETPRGGEARPYYIDGFKYINLSSAEEFEAVIEALSHPVEFALADGSLSLSNGLFVTQQPRRPFGLSYRSRVGNDVDGSDHGYKLHIVYNALADPAERENSTLNDNPEPTKLSWAITTTPPFVAGFRPTSHFVVDSRLTAPELLRDVEDQLYGTSMTQPRLPTPSALIAMFSGG